MHTGNPKGQDNGASSLGNAQRDQGPAVESNRLAIGITLAAGLAAALHLAFRNVPVDNLTVALAAVAALPWLAQILRTVTLPGGVTVEFRQLSQRIDSLDARVEKLNDFVLYGIGNRQREQLSAYLMKLRDYSTQFTGRLPEPPPVYVEGTSMASCYDRINHEITIQRDFAHDPDVVGREYMHSILDVRPRSDEFEVRGLESGLADYFVASAKGESRLYESHYPIQLANERKFAEPFKTNDAGNDLGEIWGGAFWRVRELLGRLSADAILWNAWMQTPVQASEGTTIRTVFLEQLVACVQEQRGSTEARDVRAIFASRGISMINPLGRHEP
jgi:hypothetical protein